jgi:hypothetical protein
MVSEIDKTATAVFERETKAIAGIVCNVSHEVHRRTYCSGAIDRNGFLAAARSQLSFNSPWWLAAHSRTSPITRGGNRPSSNRSQACGKRTTFNS